MSNGPLRARALGALLASTMLMGGSASAAGLTGAIFTTESTCTGTNVNIFSSKDDVHLDGGPPVPRAAGLPDGSYYVQVTTPDGTLLGTSVGTANPTPVQVTDGEFGACYQLSAILARASDGQPGYDTTTNAGGEYKVWVSTSSGFDPSASKTDNFKVRAGATRATLDVVKFYDANANGINDDAQPVSGWEIRIQDGIDYVRFTPVSIVVDPDDYTVTESAPIETNWIGTTPNPVLVSLAAGDAKRVEFGNLCQGAGGGRTLGFWSNKNGQAMVGGDDLTLLGALNLRNASGAAFDPGTYAQFRSWILNATATNMAYMLSAQLAAMQLSVANGLVNGAALVSAPGATSANSLGFATVSALMSEANAELGVNGSSTSSGAIRTYQEALKNALDRANNNTTFVQPGPCAFTFASRG